MIDLHTHSTASDGDLKPAELLEKASTMGLKALALTDHDTVSGLEAAQKAAGRAKITFIPGVELEIQTEKPETGPILEDFGTEGPGPAAGVGGEFHLLGLGITRPTEEFFAVLEFLGGARDRRNLKMLEKMRAAGIDVEYDQVKAFAGGGLIGRPHFGAFLISRKLVKNQELAFKRWLGKGRPFYVPKEGLEFGMAVRLIHEAGGAVVLAHPMSLYVSWGRLPRLVAGLKEQGLDGLEAWHPTAKVKACKRLEELGRELGLLVTAGSDFHGSARPDRKLGYTAGDKPIEDRFWEDLSRAINLG